MSQISRFITGANQLDFSGDTGTGSPQNDVMNIVGGNNVTTNVAGNTITINSSATASLSFEGDGGGTAQPSNDVIQIDGGSNITTSAANDTVTFNLDQTVTSLNTIRFNLGGAVESGQTGGDTYTLDAYDTNAASYTNFITFTAGNPPTADLNTSVTQGGTTIYRVGGQDVALSDGGTGIDASGATDGQLLIGGSASNDLQLNTLTAGSNISIINGTNSITIAASATGATTFQTDGSNATASSGTITMSGGANITTSGSGSTVTYDLDQTLTDMNKIELNETNSTGSIGVIYMDNSATPERFIHAAGSFGITNFFAGNKAGNFSLSGTNNVGIGQNALQSVTNGQANIAIGTNAASSSPSGVLNTVIGNQVMREPAGGTTTRRGNTALGGKALLDLTDNENNTAIGLSALQNVVSGTENTALGAQAGINLTTSDSNNIHIHNDGTAGDNNKIVIGNSTDHSSTYIAGIQGSTPSGTTETVVIDNNNQLGSETRGTELIWQAQGSDITMSVNNGYIPSGTSGMLTLTLPTTAAVGDRVSVAGYDADGWRVAQNSGQIIHFGNQDTNTGTTGYVQYTLRYDCVELICVVADTEWVVRHSVGDIVVN